MERDSRIYVAGHRGLVGSALVRCLQAQGYENLLLAPREELELSNWRHVMDWFGEMRPEYVMCAAATVGGIEANIARPADMLADNLKIALNVVEACRLYSVRKLLMLGSSCIYPRGAPQPMKEEYLLAGSLELTNRAYALAKIVSLEMCDAYRRQHGCNFISAMPCNLYGINDTFDPQRAHVIPALMHKLHRAKQESSKQLWILGTGRELREFLYADDLAAACILLMEQYSDYGPINIGSGREITIAQLTKEINKLVGFKGYISCSQKHAGVGRKLIDSSKMMAMGWEPHVGLEEGLTRVYEDYLARL